MKNYAKKSYFLHQEGPKAVEIGETRFVQIRAIILNSSDKCLRLTMWVSGGRIRTSSYLEGSREPWTSKAVNWEKERKSERENSSTTAHRPRERSNTNLQKFGSWYIQQTGYSKRVEWVGLKGFKAQNNFFQSSCMSSSWQNGLFCADFWLLTWSGHVLHAEGPEQHIWGAQHTAQHAQLREQHKNKSVYSSDSDDCIEHWHASEPLSNILLEMSQHQRISPMCKMCNSEDLRNMPLCIIEYVHREKVNMANFAYLLCIITKNLINMADISKIYNMEDIQNTKPWSWDSI